MSVLGPLNLGDADTSGFQPMEPGRYNATIFDVTLDAVKNASGLGKMPAGTPMVKVQFRIEDEPYVNMRAWANYIIPPNDYDHAKSAKIKGMFVNFLVAIGEPEEKVRSGGYDPDLEDFKGRECVVVLGKEQRRDQNGNTIEGEYNNPVKGVKPAGSLAGGSGDSGGGLL
jgi:Protein of unknown function (DUF669)